jgi:hypothetical protein
MDKEAIFHFLDLTIPISFIILASCGSKLWHWQFRLTLVRDLVQEAGRVPQTQTTRQGRKPLSMSQLKWADTRHNRHWLMQCKRIQCRMFCQRQRKRNEIQVSWMQRRFVCYLEHGFVWYWNLDASGSRSETPGKFWNVVLKKDGEDQLDRSCEKWRSVT